MHSGKHRTNPHDAGAHGALFPYPVVVMHGWSQSAHNQQKWQPFLDALAQHNLNVEFLGLPGLSTPLSEVWTLETYTKWLAEQLQVVTKQYGVTKVILLGHSFGGQLAVRFARINPHLVRALILVDSAGIRDTRPLKQLKRAMFWVLAKVGRVFSQVPWARLTLYKLARERDYFEASPVMRKTMQIVLNDEVRADLPQLSVPTLIIWGEHDQATPLFLGEQFHRAIHGSGMRVVTGARHSPQFTNTAETAEYVLQFVDQLEETNRQ